MTVEQHNGGPALERVLRESLEAEARASASRAERGAQQAWDRAGQRLPPEAAGRSRATRGVSRDPLRWVGLALAGAVAVAGVVFFGFRLGWIRPGAPAPSPSPWPVATNPRPGEANVGYYPPGVVLADPRLPQTGGPQASRPAPMFRNTFRPTSDPFPPKVGQQVTFVSQPGWQGKRVWVYVAPAKEQETIMYDRQLPKNAILIGIADIDQADGRWTLSWTIPHEVSHGDASLSFDGPDSWFNVATVTDTGYLAGSGLPIGPDRTLEVSPEDVVVGQVLTIRGSGYPPDERVRLDILHDRPEPQGGTDLEVTIGWVRTDAEGKFTFDYKVPARFNWAYADNRNIMQDHWLTAGAPGTYSILAVEYEGDAKSGSYTLEKRVGVRAAK